MGGGMEGPPVRGPAGPRFPSLPAATPPRQGRGLRPVRRWSKGVGGGGDYVWSRGRLEGVGGGGRLEGLGGGGGLEGVGVLVLVLASTQPVVSDASLSAHAQPKAWECGAYRRYFLCSSRVSSLRCPRCAPRTWTTGPPHCMPGAPTWSLTCSLIGSEELNYGGPLAELHRLQCCRHVHMVRWDCCPDHTRQSTKSVQQDTSG